MKQTGNYHEGYIDGVDSRLGEIQNLKDEIESLTTKLKQESECVDFMKETTDNYEKEIERLKGDKWIRVEDSLPKNNGEKVIFHGDGYVMFGFFHDGCFKDVFPPHQKVINVSQWQPLPPKPIN